MSIKYKMELDGLDDLLKKFDELQKEAPRLLTALTVAGCDGAVRGWRDEVKASQHIETFTLYKSIDYDRKAVLGGGVYASEVYPRGESTQTTVPSAKGKKNIKRKLPIKVARYAAYLHYGTRKIKASGWIDRAHARAEKLAHKKVTERFALWIRKDG